MFSTFGADIAAALPELRAAAESLMTDVVRLERVTGQAPDPDTLEMVDAFETVYEGKGRWQRPDTVAAEQVAGGVEFGVGRATVQLPISVVTAARGQRVTCLASDTDPALPGTQATVLGVPSKTHATMRRLLCEEVS